MMNVLLTKQLNKDLQILITGIYVLFLSLGGSIRHILLLWLLHNLQIVETL